MSAGQAETLRVNINVLEDLMTMVSEPRRETSF